ncbi:S-adenosyl-L-methionine-dependent methyltransferase [Geopyxis carbonaria]|nr:S-adenosyl-L-methionine-dependent methyltransferase [Geopyxis carbonaria]
MTAPIPSATNPITHASAESTSNSGLDSKSPDIYEAEHVHRVYQQIAPHFSATRFKPWPVVDRFLKERPPGSVGLDVGCGNGKYLTVNPDIYIIGSDRSSNLIRIAYDRKVQDSVVADAIDLPHPDGRFDFAFSIAVIHHFSSPDRRALAIKTILRTLRGPSTQNEQAGKALIVVWALEQKNSRRGWGEGDQQDIFVPWVLSKQYSTLSPNKLQEGFETKKEVTYQRYYHLYRKGELESDIIAAGGVIHESGYEKDNWWAICGPSA